MLAGRRSIGELPKVGEPRLGSGVRLDLKFRSIEVSLMPFVSLE
jgi:hypothetical protein